MVHNPNAHHFYVSKCIVSNIQLYVSNIKRMFPIYRLCFQTPFNVSNVQFLFPISNLCFQMKMMFPNDNVSNVCFQYKWSPDEAMKIKGFESDRNRVVVLNGSNSVLLSFSALCTLKSS